MKTCKYFSWPTDQKQNSPKLFYSSCDMTQKLTPVSGTSLSKFCWNFAFISVFPGQRRLVFQVLFVRRSSVSQQLTWLVWVVLFEQFIQLPTDFLLGENSLELSSATFPLIILITPRHLSRGEVFGSFCGREASFPANAMSKQIDVTVPDSETLSSEKSKRFTVRTVLCSSLCECVKLQQQLVCMVRTMLCSACH